MTVLDLCSLSSLNYLHLKHKGINVLNANTIKQISDELSLLEKYIPLKLEDLKDTPYNNSSGYDLCDECFIEYIQSFTEASLLKVVMIKFE